MKFKSQSILLILALCPLFLFAQSQKPTAPKERITMTMTPKKGKSQSPTYVNPLESTNEPQWNLKLSQKGNIGHSIDENDKLAVLKAEKTAIKLEEAIELRKQKSNQINTEKSVASSPAILTRFESNEDDGWSPPDNDMAISDEGYVVSVINSAVSYLDSDGNYLLANQTYGDLLAGVGVSSFLFDPKVLYDPVAERFIMVVLAGNTPSTSEVVVGFSLSQNPVDGWNFYTFSEDFLGDNWFDYPNIGISANDVFITGNLFSENDGFDQVVLLQIDKANGYAGEEIEWEYFNDVSIGFGQSAFTVVPASHGYDTEYGPGIFMISSRGFQGEEVYLFEVTDSLNADQEINAYVIPTSYYEAPGDAVQLGSDAAVSTGGCRTRTAFYNDGILHFVFGSDKFFNGYTGINYNRLDVNTLNLESEIYSQPNQDCAYPTVIPFGADESSQEVMIGYLNSSASIFPQLAVVHVDEDMNFSDQVVTKGGSSPIGSANATSVRWGDYSGGGRNHASPYANAWFVGCLGQDNRYGNWIYEVTIDAGVAPVADFEGYPRQFEIGGTAYYTSLALNGADSYLWNFPGGVPATSTEPNAFVQYDVEGQYDVELIVTNAFGSDTINKVNYVRALSFPVSDFTSDVTEGDVPLTVNYENLSTGVVTATWIFNGGTPATTTELNPTVVYENTGKFNATLLITNDSGTDLETKVAYITVNDATATLSPSEMKDVVVFPNPASSEFKLGFYLPKKTMLSVYLVDANGSVVKSLLHGRVKGGRNEMSFNKNALAPGNYFLIIEDEEKNVISNEKIIITQ